LALSRRIDKEDLVMKSYCAFLVAGAFALAAPATISAATAASRTMAQRAGTAVATDFSAHRHVRRHHRHHAHYRPRYQPYYYDRPVYYRPYPYASPAPFTFGIGFGPVW
jgi:hypothetical protein